MLAPLAQKSGHSACDDIAECQPAGLRMRTKLDHHVGGNLDRDGNDRFGHRNWTLDLLRVLQISVRLADREAKLRRQPLRRLVERVSLGEQIERSVQVLGPFRMSGSRHMS